MCTADGTHQGAEPGEQRIGQPTVPVAPIDVHRRRVRALVDDGVAPLLAAQPDTLAWPGHGRSR